MYFCSDCGATKGTSTIGCLAYFSRGPHAFVLGSHGMACYYCDCPPGGAGTRCQKRMSGGCHDFREVMSRPKEGRTGGEKAILLDAPGAL